MSIGPIDMQPMVQPVKMPDAVHSPNAMAVSQAALASQIDQKKHDDLNIITEFMDQDESEALSDSQKRLAVFRALKRKQREQERQNQNENSPENFEDEEDGQEEIDLPFPHLPKPATPDDTPHLDFNA